MRHVKLSNSQLCRLMLFTLFHRGIIILHGGSKRRVKRGLQYNKKTGHWQSGKRQCQCGIQQAAAWNNEPLAAAAAMNNSKTTKSQQQQPEKMHSAEVKKRVAGQREWQCACAEVLCSNICNNNEATRKYNCHGNNQCDSLKLPWKVSQKPKLSQNNEQRLILQTSELDNVPLLHR